MNENPSPDVCAALIAGGKSSRMGRDKRLIEIDGQPLWLRQIEVLQSLNPAELVISGPLNGPWSASDYKIIPDRVKDVGPLAGIVAVLKSVRSPLVLVLAVDMPQMLANYLRLLLDKCRADCGVVPLRGKLYEPLAAVYPRACVNIAQGQLQSGKHNLQSFVQACVDAGMLAPIKITSAEDLYFRNLNQPHDIVGNRKT